MEKNKKNAQQGKPSVQKGEHQGGQPRRSEDEGGRNMNNPPQIVYHGKARLSSTLRKKNVIITGMVDKKCIRCGKNFIPTRPFYQYEDCCSYTCWIHKDDGKKSTHIGRPVAMYSKSGVFLRDFDTAYDAAQYANIVKPDNIRLCCNGKVKTSGGYIWKWKKEGE